MEKDCVKSDECDKIQPGHRFVRVIFMEKVILMKQCQRVSAWLMILMLLLSFCPLSVQAAEEKTQVTILFTHDLHSRFLPQPAEGGGESGGYARLKNVIDAQKAVHPDALLLDAGDFSIGSLIQTLYTTQAAELRTMGAMGYDATTIGNHEFDHTGVGFAEMLNAAKDAQTAAMRVLADSQYPSSLMQEYFAQYGPLTFALPAMLGANYVPAPENRNAELIQKAMDNYGVQETMLLERGGVTYGLFGLVGVDSHECAPTSGFELLDAAKAAERCVASLKEQGAEVIICLSHAGTGDSLAFSEDEVLAEKVDGIDVIVSGHTHTTLREPIVVNDTYIISAGPYCENLGTVSFDLNEDGSLELTEYTLIPVDETVPEDEEIANMVEIWKTMVGEGYLSRYDLTYDEVLTTSAFDLNLPTYGVQQGNNLGELAADSFLWAVENLEADAPDVPTVSITADGVLRAVLAAGPITTSQAFDVLSMGIGSDGTSGFPLVGVYLTGKELKAAVEVDASVTPIMPAAQLYIGGMEYSFNTHRMFFDRVTSVRLYQDEIWSEPAAVLGKPGEVSADFTVTHKERQYTELEDDQLYRVVTGMYSAQMLGTVKSKSLGLLSLEPKMADGSPVTDFNECILRDANGNEIKEWYALATYLQMFGEEGIPKTYATADGRKDVSSEVSFTALGTHLNWISILALTIAFLPILLVATVVRFIIWGKRRKKE